MSQPVFQFDDNCTREVIEISKEETGKTIIAIDPGFSNLGYAVFTSGYLRYSGCFQVTEKKEFDKFKKINEFIESLFYNCGVINAQIAMESGFMGKYRKGFDRLAEVRGVIISKCVMTGTPFFKYTPTEVKKAITGKGNAKKEVVNRFINSRLGSSIQSCDETDAIAIGLTHMLREKLINTF